MLVSLRWFLVKRILIVHVVPEEKGESFSLLIRICWYMILENMDQLSILMIWIYMLGQIWISFLTCAFTPGNFNLAQLHRG